MKSSKPFLPILIIILIISSAKAQWTPCQGIEGMDCISIVTQDTFLLIAGDGGIYKKSIAAPAWDPASLIGGFSKVRSTGTTLFCYDASFVYRSLDNGLTWEEIHDTGDENQNIETIDSVIFLDTHFALYRSMDNGNNWTEIHPSPLTADIEGIYSQSGILYCYLENVSLLFLSFDYGDTWISYPLTGIIGGAWQPYFYNNRLWLASLNKFYVYNNIMYEWILQQDSLPANVWHSIFYEDGETLCCYTNDGYFSYDNQNMVWEDESEGLENRFCWDACQSDSTIFLATDSGPFSKTGNDTWIPQYNDLFGLEVTQVFYQNSNIYALADGKIYCSDDAELNFVRIDAQNYCPAHKMITHDSGLYAGSDCGFSISTDSGYTWTNYSNGIEDYSVYDVAITSPYYFSLVNNGDNGLFRSLTYHDEWERVPNELGTMSLSDIDLLDNVLFAIGGSSLYRSNDFGTTFELLPDAGSGGLLFVKNNKVFYINNPEIKYSADEGLTWQTWISGIAGAESINCIDISDSEDMTVVGGFVGPWSPVPFLKMYTTENPEGQDIMDNLPRFYWYSMSDVMFDGGRLFACPSSGGLWYRDDLMVGVSEKDAQKPEFSRLSVYPDPAKDVIKLLLNKDIEDAEYQVVDYCGKIMIKGKFENVSDDFSVDVSSLPAGIFIIILKDPDGLLSSAKFLKIR